MTLARDPNQYIILNNSMQKVAEKHMAGIRRQLRASGSIWEEPGRHLGGAWEASERHLGGIWKAPGRHLESTLEAPGRHLGAIWSIRGILEAREAGGKNIQNQCVLRKKLFCVHGTSSTFTLMGNV